ncbi:hypothetical protein ILUMI_08232 [Ignelater luminosus]|uniref:C2H2-type domain-containing protein n=1 Tax=Ignelater luminosus TaxID=2038154 RepID=A0A8K0GFL2_IGNLU|nr:hypothetical protein ILUMI_08232 [Ignelater luminosus]
MSQLICRTCLEEIIDSNCISLDDETNEIKQKLTLCVPELDLDVIPNACMCIYCANLLQTAYDFKQRCLRTEEKIRINENLPDLSQIKENIEKDEKFDVVHGVGIGMEVVFIKDEDLVIEDDDDDDTRSESQHLSNGSDCVNWFLDLSNPEKQEQGHLDNYKLKNVNTKVNSSKRNLISNKLSNKLNKNVEIRNNKKPVKTNIFTKKSYNCPNCKYQTSFENYFKKHIRYCKTSNVANGSKIIKSETTLKCLKCDYTTKLKRALDLHVRRAHGKEKKLNCSKCSYTAVSLFLLKQHITNSHSLMTSDKSQFKCKLCPFGTDFQKGFKSHLRKHKREETFSCKYCSFKAKEKIHITKHAMKHHPKKKM